MKKNKLKIAISKKKFITSKMTRLGSPDRHSDRDFRNDPILIRLGSSEDDDDDDDCESLLSRSSSNNVDTIDDDPLPNDRLSPDL